MVVARSPITLIEKIYVIPLRVFKDVKRGGKSCA